MNEYDINRDIEIDSYNLEAECITMASTYYKYAEMNRQAKSLVSEKADNVKVVRAVRSIAIREENKDKKLTVDMVAALVDSDSQVAEANRELREAEATFDKIAVMVKSMEIKKSELDNLVKLKCNSMYVDSPARPTRDLNSETSGEYLRKSMSSVPNR